MYTKKTVINNKTGLHARPASEFVDCANRFASSIEIRKLSDNKSANGKSIVKLLLLAIACGEEVELTAEGVDESEAVDTLIDLLDSGFGEA